MFPSAYARCEFCGSDRRARSGGTGLAEVHPRGGLKIWCDLVASNCGPRVAWVGSFDRFVGAMPPFHTDSVALTYSDVEGARRWWIGTFDGKVARVPPDWDHPLPSDVAVQLPGQGAPTILLDAKSEAEQAGYDRPSPVASVIFCDNLNLKKAHEKPQKSRCSPRAARRWRYAVLRNPATARGISSKSARSARTSS